MSTLRVSVEWYERVLGFQRAGEYTSPDGQRQKVFLSHPDMRVRLGLTQHHSGSTELFDERRVGLDHLAFKVESEAELIEWENHLAGRGVRYTPMTTANSLPGAKVVVFRDPDNIQLELFFDPATG